FGVAFFFKAFLNTNLTTGSFWTYILLIHNYFNQVVLFPLANLWAMGVTEQFYLLIGIFFLIFPKFSWKHALFLTILGVIINKLSFSFNFYNYPHSHNYLTDFGAGVLLAVFGTGSSKIMNWIKNHSLVWVL